MLRIIPQFSTTNAMSYYSTSDYYTESQDLSGQWHGLGAERLGLSGPIQQSDWDALCHNINPNTGERLTVRNSQKNRRVGYDFNFHVPKSVSLLYGLTQDQRIVDAFGDSVNQTMLDMEREMQTRVRIGGRNEDRTTANMVWGEFIHFTSRPVDGIPDPHLHAHCFVFSATHDPIEDRWKAGQFAGIKRDASYFEALFHSRMAQKLAELGLSVERTRNGYELSGLNDRSLLTRFSRRTTQIEEKALREGITDPEAKGELGARTRVRKAKDLTMDQLRHEWFSRLSDTEQKGIALIADSIGTEPISLSPDLAPDAIREAVSHCFERKSVVPERTLLAQALRRSLGTVSQQAIHAAYNRDDFLSAAQDGRMVITTPQVLDEEKRMIDFARSGRGACLPINSNRHIIQRDWLNDDQRRAVDHVLSSRDRVTLIRGVAGVGKTSMMKEAVEAIERTGTSVFVFAPSADASRGVLREQEGFATADTVARLLVDTDFQERIRNQIIWIDEAGLLGTKTMQQVFELADHLDARVILMGDKRQHASVERGAALRLLETEAGCMPAEIRDIQRQKGQYKQVVRALSEGRIDEGFNRLDQLGWIKESHQDERYKQLASDYVASIAGGETALVVSPTHREAEKIDAEIRIKLQKLKHLKPDERKIRIFKNLNLTQAERADPAQYSDDSVIVFHQNAKGFGKGDRITAGNGPVLLDQAARFQVFQPGELAIAPGEMIRITQNGKTLDGHRLNNGSTYTVTGFTPQGNMILSNGWMVSKDYGHLTYGYVSTSHASQGKSVDHIIIGQSVESWPASSQEQFYVSVSRGKKRVTIHTDDKQSLLDSVRQSDSRQTATELLNERVRLIELNRAGRERAIQIVPERGGRELTHER